MQFEKCFASFGLSSYLDKGFSFCFLFMRVDCECNRPSFLATVFSYASSFNGDLNQWDVAEVTTMESSKSIRIVENDVKSCCCDCRVQSGVWGWW